MSKKKRAMERQKKLNSPKAKAKRQKKAYYASYEAYVKWQEKKERKWEKKLQEQGEL